MGDHERVSSTNHALLVQIGKRIRLLRKRKGWTQIDMAVALDMNRGHSSDIEPAVAGVFVRREHSFTTLLNQSIE